ncbi:MAG: polysaccharide deacetylase family protein [Hyphomonadaceae bacterium]|nr:MAG: polysaccharide deacetylase [Caulobacteraceae bacterium]MBT9445554.1 polysaccharide deacetylase family protein [Hyphomonadaceae bacterium]TPW06964.1 MAG: polysaccharide deacetylase [Alphaproteobacteria bacterium]
MTSARSTDGRVAVAQAAARASARGAGRFVARPAQVRLEKPVISFTFDNFPKSAVRNAGAILEAAGGRGTFYASAAFAGQTTQYGGMFDGADLTRLTAAGHEIGCHTFACLDCGRGPTDDVFADMVRNADALSAMGLEERLVSFAYPFGHASAALKQLLPTRFTTARGMSPGVAAGRIDLAQLPANALFGEDAQKRAPRLMELARRKKGWLIFYTHDVSPRPTAWGSQTGLLERIVTAAYATGIEIAPVREVATRILAAASA